MNFICEKCDERCDVIEKHESEPYEFWGLRGFHHYSTLISHCCGDDVREIDEDGNADIRLRDRRPSR